VNHKLGSFQGVVSDAFDSAHQVGVVGCSRAALLWLGWYLLKDQVTGFIRGAAGSVFVLPYDLQSAAVAAGIRNLLLCAMHGVTTCMNCKDARHHFELVTGGAGWRHVSVVHAALDRWCLAVLQAGVPHHQVLKGGNCWRHVWVVHAALCKLH
jgi:hypothetical protein